MEHFLRPEILIMLIILTTVVGAFTTSILKAKYNRDEKLAMLKYTNGEK